MTDIRRKSINRIMGLIAVTTNVELQERLWKRADALTDKIVDLTEDKIICDACGETFKPEDDVEEDVTEQMEEASWISDDEGTFCPEHKTCHPAHTQVDYGRNILELGALL